MVFELVWVSKRSSAIPGSLVTVVKINKEVDLCGKPMIGGYGTIFVVENDFVFNSQIAAEIWKELKCKIKLKLDQRTKKPQTERLRVTKNKYNSFTKSQM